MYVGEQSIEVPIEEIQARKPNSRRKFANFEQQQPTQPRIANLQDSRECEGPDKPS